MLGQILQLLECDGVPNLDGVVIGAAGDDFAVLGHGEAEDRAFVGVMGFDEKIASFGGGWADFPLADTVIDAGRKKPLTIGTE